VIQFVRLASAECIHGEITQATVGWDGGSDLDGGLGGNNDNDNDNGMVGEEGRWHCNDNNDNNGHNIDGDDNGRGEYGEELGENDGGLMDPVDLFAAFSDVPTGINNSFTIEDKSVAAAATARTSTTAATTSSETSGGKRSSAPKWVGGGGI
jgi:hypothetical protein